MKTFPCAKINLGLNIVGKRPDGYHNLQTVFYPIALTDELEATQIDGFGRCELFMEGAPIEGNPSDNLVAKAYRLLSQRFPIRSVRFTLKKNIPTQAGLGGGSSDGAYTVMLLNEMFSLGLSQRQMADLVTPLGADCPFFVYSSPCYAEGIGELLSPQDVALGCHLAIVKPPVAVSTREAFAGIEVRQPAQNCRDIVARPISTWAENLTNDFEDSIFPQHPEIRLVKEKLYELGAIFALMSGSGSSLFALFSEPVDLQRHFPDCFCALIPPSRSHSVAFAP